MAKNIYGLALAKNVSSPPVTKQRKMLHGQEYLWPSNSQKYQWPSHGQKYLRPSHGPKYLWPSHGQ